MSTVIFDKVDDFDNNQLTDLDSKKVNRNPLLGEEVSIKNYIDDELHQNTILRLKQTSENCFKISVEISVYSLTNYEAKLYRYNTNESTDCRRTSPIKMEHEMQW